MKKLLITSYWIGIIADGIASLLLFSPAVANIVLRPQPFAIGPVYLYVSRIGGTMMLGWTILLFWAQRKPIERADILLITLFPVVTFLAGSAFFVAKSNQIALSTLAPLFLLYVLLYCTYIPSYLWARKHALYGS